MYFKEHLYSKLVTGHGKMVLQANDQYLRDMSRFLKIVKDLSRTSLESRDTIPDEKIALKT